MIRHLEVRNRFIGRIRFSPSKEKLSTCLSFMQGVIIANPEYLSLDKGAALILAEASHLSAYGRPVTGCSYIHADGRWHPDLLLGDSGEEILHKSLEHQPATDARHHSISSGSQLPDNIGELFPDISISDTEHLLKAMELTQCNPAAARDRIAGMMHEGKPDYALMLEDDDPVMLLRKLEDLSDICRYIYLGRRS